MGAEQSSESPKVGYHVLQVRILFFYVEIFLCYFQLTETRFKQVVLERSVAWCLISILLLRLKGSFW